MGSHPDEIVILVGHGSPRKEANNMEAVGNMFHNMLHPGCTAGCVRVSYLQFETPDLKTAIEGAAALSPGKIIVHPFFLYSGMHVTRDIPEIIDRARSEYPGIEFIHTEPVGISAEIIDTIKERVDAANGKIKPGDIEKRSFEKIEAGLDGGLQDIPPLHRPIVLRVIHATGDFDFKSGLHIHPDAVREGIKAIREGMDIVSDVEMVRAGINKRLLSKWGGRAICGISDADVGGTKTRAEAGIGAAVSANTGIIAIGNAPSALMSAINSILEGKFRPKLLIGVPVGFVKAVEAKTFLSVQSFPFITNHGRKGGSAACAAIVNALLRMADEVEEREG